MCAYRLSVRVGPLLVLLAALSAEAGSPVEQDRNDGMRDSAERVVELDELLEIAARRNPGIDAAQWELYVSKSLITQKESEYLPQLSAQIEYLRGYYPVGAENTGAHEEFNSYTADVSGEQYVYGFGKVAGRVRESRQRYVAVRKDLDTTVADIVQRVRRAYYEVLKKEELVVVNEETVRTQGTHLAQARDFYALGVRPKVDVTKAEVDWARSQFDLVKARTALEVARVELENVVGGPPVEGPYRLASVEVLVVPVGVLEPLVDAALGRRPEVQAAKARIRAAKALHGAVRGEFWPSVHAMGQYGWQDTGFPLDDAWLVGARLSWEFFPGLRTVGEVREAKARVNVLDAHLKQLELDVVKEVSQAYLLLVDGAESIVTAQVALEFATENMKLIEGRYEAGLASAIEFNDAVLDLTGARSDLVRSKYSYLQAEANLDRAVGGSFRELWGTPPPAPAHGADSTK